MIDIRHCHINVLIDTPVSSSAGLEKNSAGCGTSKVPDSAGLFQYINKQSLNKIPHKIAKLVPDSVGFSIKSIRHAVPHSAGTSVPFSRAHTHTRTRRSTKHAALCGTDLQIAQS